MRNVPGSPPFVNVLWPVEGAGSRIRLDPFQVFDAAESRGFLLFVELGFGVGVGPLTFAILEDGSTGETGRYDTRLLQVGRYFGSKRAK